MGNLVLNGSTSGSITVSPTAVAGSNTLTLPAKTGNIITSADSATVTPTMLSQPVTATGLVATTSGTTITLATGLPSWTRQISIIWSGVGTGSTSNFLIQLGYGGTPTYVTSGYASNTGGYINGQSTAGFVVGHDTLANTYQGIYNLFIIDPSTNTWAGGGYFTRNAATANSLVCGGSLALSSNVLTAIRLTTVSGDTFNAGSINVFYG